MTQPIARIARDFSEDPLFVSAVLLLDRAEHVVHWFTDVVPVRDSVLEDVGHKAAGAETLAHRDARADFEGGVEAEEHRVRVEERHAGVAAVVGAQTEVAGHGLADQKEFEVIVEDALRQARGAGGVDRHQVPIRVDLQVGRIERLARLRDFARQAAQQVARTQRQLAGRAQHQHVLRRDVRKALAHAIHLGKQPLVDDEDPRLGLIHDASERVAAKARVHAEQRQTRVGATAVQRQQLEMVLEQHRDMAGPPLVDRPEAPEQEMRDAHAFVAILPEGPGAFVLNQEDAISDVGMHRARFDLRADRRESVDHGSRGCSASHVAILRGFGDRILSQGYACSTAGKLRAIVAFSFR